MQDKGVTPGRIGTVFFFPKDSLTILSDKQPQWAALTAMGQKPYTLSDSRDDLSAELAELAEEANEFSTPMDSDTISKHQKLFIRIPPLHSVTQDQNLCKNQQ